MRLWLPLALTLGLAACGSAGHEGDMHREEPAPAMGERVQAEGGSYMDISAQELRAMLANKDFLLVNVHVPYQGEIEGTDLFIPYDQIADRLDELPQDKDAKIVLYCRSGGMSGIASRALVRLGYNNVWNLAGGMIAWEQAGYPLLRGR